MCSRVLTKGLKRPETYPKGPCNILQLRTLRKPGLTLMKVKRDLESCVNQGLYSGLRKKSSFLGGPNGGYSCGWILWFVKGKSTINTEILLSTSTGIQDLANGEGLNMFKTRASTMFHGSPKHSKALLLPCLCFKDPEAPTQHTQFADRSTNRGFFLKEDPFQLWKHSDHLRFFLSFIHPQKNSPICQTLEQGSAGFWDFIK